MNSPIHDRLGTELAEGRYRISARIGEGSMGHVYRAFDAHLQTDVVVKFPVPPEGSDDAGGFLERFARESRSMIRLSHPHIVRVIDVGEDDGLPFVVMAFLDGGSLKDRLEPTPEGDPRPLPPESLHGWLMDVARALDFVHGQGHIHRDVKPANILFDRHGNAFLADFGVVKRIRRGGDPESNRSDLTAAGYLLGTPNYVAPELVMGDPSDGRVDQYALALTVHEALTGWNCMEGPTPSSTLVNQTKVEPPLLASLLREVPPGLSEAVARGLSKDPADRFENCASLARAILANVPPLVAGQPLSTPELISPASKGTSGRVPCPACGGLLPVVREHAGRRITCTRCRATAMVQLGAGAGTVQLLLVNPPPEAPPVVEPRSPAQARLKPKARPGQIQLGIEVEPEPLSPHEPEISRRHWIGTGLAGIGLLATGGVAGWFLRSGRSPAGPGAAPAILPVNPNAPIELNIVHATELKNWLEVAAEQFRNAPAGQGIAIRLIGRPSLEGLDDVLNSSGAKPVHVWIPAGNAYRKILEREWKIRRPGAAKPVARSTNLVHSPLVAIFWKERHDALLKKYGRINLTTIGQAMHEPGGWATIAGQPDWGLFRFAHANPSRSNSGLMTLALLGYDFAGKTRDLTLADLTRADFHDRLARFEHGLARPGGSLVESTGRLLEEMIARGPAQYDGVISYENLAIDSFATARERRGDFEVVYLDPNIANEHPYTILETSETDAGRQHAASAFLDHLMSPPVQFEAIKRGFRPGNPTLSASTPGGPLTTREEQGFRLEIPRPAESPPVEVIDDLIAAFRRLEL